MRFCCFSWFHRDSAEGITSDSFGHVAKPCLSPKRRTRSSSGVKRELAWVRSLVYHVHKICSSQELLREELHNIVKFASWNGFPHWLTKKLTRSFAPTANPTNVNESSDKLPVIWIRLPFIGKTGTSLIRKCTRKISRLLPHPAKFMTLWGTTNTNTFLTLKDSTPKEHQRSVVYKFTCPGCQASYIGKTDRCLYMRIKEHAYNKNSEIYNHINTCEHFLHIQSLLNLPSNIYNLNESTILPQIIFNNCKILNKAKHWALLLFKEALSIHREKPLLNHGTKASKELVIFY